MPYHLTWKAERHPEGIAKTEVPPGHDACDAILIASVVGEFGNGKPLSVMFFSAVGTGDDAHTTLDDGELFEIWSMLAKNLSESIELGDGRRQLADFTFEAVRSARLGTPSPFSMLVQAADVITAARKLAQHWTAQDGVNAAVIDELVAAVNAMDGTAS